MIFERVTELILVFLDSHFAFDFNTEDMKGAKFYYEFATHVDKRSQERLNHMRRYRKIKI